MVDMPLNKEHKHTQLVDMPIGWYAIKQRTQTHTISIMKSPNYHFGHILPN